MRSALPGARACAVLVVTALATVACEDEPGAEADPCDVCADIERCVIASDVTCEAVCAGPRLPRVERLPLGATLPLPAGTQVALGASDDVTWEARATIALDALGPTTVRLRWAEAPAACARLEPPTFEATYTVVEALPAADEGDDAAAGDAVALDDARIVGWATGWVSPVAFGGELDAVSKDVALALGPATGAWDDAVSLGNGGAATFTFDVPLSDGPGLDLAVFENGFSAQFLELGFVEVSSDGTHFARFDALSFQSEPVAQYGTLDAREVTGVAGRYAGGYGVGFDLATLVDHPLVLSGRVDLAALAFVRVVDVVGGDSRDAVGAPLFDPTPTVGPAGFDVEALAVLGAP